MNSAGLSRRNPSLFDSERDFRAENGSAPSNQEDSYARLRSLDEETQERIAKKYYNGTRPWEPSGKKHRRTGGMRSIGFETERKQT